MAIVKKTVKIGQYIDHVNRGVYNHLDYQLTPTEIEFDNEDFGSGGDIINNVNSPKVIDNTSLLSSFPTADNEEFVVTKKYHPNSANGITFNYGSTMYRLANNDEDVFGYSFSSSNPNKRWIPMHNGTMKAEQLGAVLLIDYDQSELGIQSTVKNALRCVEIAFNSGISIVFNSGRFDEYIGYVFDLRGQYSYSIGSTDFNNSSIAVLNDFSPTGADSKISLLDACEISNVTFISFYNFSYQSTSSIRGDWYNVFELNLFNNTFSNCRFLNFTSGIFANSRELCNLILDRCVITNNESPYIADIRGYQRKCNYAFKDCIISMGRIGESAIVRAEPIDNIEALTEFREDFFSNVFIEGCEINTDHDIINLRYLGEQTAISDKLLSDVNLYINKTIQVPINVARFQSLCAFNGGDLHNSYPAKTEITDSQLNLGTTGFSTVNPFANDTVYKNLKPTFKAVNTKFTYQIFRAGNFQEFELDGCDFAENPTELKNYILQGNEFVKIHNFSRRRLADKFSISDSYAVEFFDNKIIQQGAWFTTPVGAQNRSLVSFKNNEIEITGDAKELVSVRNTTSGNSVGCDFFEFVNNTLFHSTLQNTGNLSRGYIVYAKAKGVLVEGNSINHSFNNLWSGFLNIEWQPSQFMGTFTRKENCVIKNNKLDLFASGNFDWSITPNTEKYIRVLQMGNNVDTYGIVFSGNSIELKNINNATTAAPSGTDAFPMIHIDQTNIIAFHFNTISSFSQRAFIVGSINLNGSQIGGSGNKFTLNTD